MCGIVGYVGTRSAAELIVNGLRRLEYRGYDSAGLAVMDGERIELRRAVGKIAHLDALLETRPATGTVGIGHTRWATHGRPSEANAHPHSDCSGSLVVVHNGILENYLSLKERLIAEGHQFRSETDTEVIAHLIESYRGTGLSLDAAARATLGEIRGAYAIGILDASAPRQLIVAKHGAGAVVVGFGDGEIHLASDIPALLPHTRDVTILEDGEMAVITATEARITSLDGSVVRREPTRITWDAAMAEKDGYRHFMLKEIFEQPRAVSETFLGRLFPENGSVSLPEARLDDPEVLRRIQRVVLVACGTSYHAALVGRIMIERLAALPAEVAIASEFRYSDLLLGPETLVVAVSQSGETADTMGAVKAARQRGARVLAITNVVGSAIAREADGVLYTHAGPEIGVASSKTFTATLTACYLVGLLMGRGRGNLTAVDGRKYIDDLLAMPDLMRVALAVEGPVADLARRLAGYKSMLYLGRGVHHAVALEGALKLKEISYIHAEGYPAGEMKHGPIALIDEHMPVVALAPRDPSYDRMLGNIEEVRARDGRVIAVCHAGDTEVARRAHEVLEVPAAPDLLAPLVSVIPLQLLAYHIAALRGLDVDQPRNLAKSVTVE
jgi:glucosamine--fructose-6-phosphate aminotransferase (isomerizing)